MKNKKLSSDCLRSCVRPDGRFRVGKHAPVYAVINLRKKDYLYELGYLPDGNPVTNQANFPAGDFLDIHGSPVYEIANPFHFRGSTYIDSNWAASKAKNPAAIAITPPQPVSLRTHVPGNSAEAARAFIVSLPLPLRYALAATSTDARELVWLAESCCEFIKDASGTVTGLVFIQEDGRIRASIDDFELFETIANNPHLPDEYKNAMVLRPGAQGTSPIMADEHHEGGSIFEYLRTNSYIPGGHYAANFANTSKRYSISELSLADMRGLRQLFYQRIYVNLAAELGLPLPPRRSPLPENELEALRLLLMRTCQKAGFSWHPSTLWGWNFGYDFSPTGYRLHASHQMIHQQYALVPPWVQDIDGQEKIASFACGDLVADVVFRYQKEYHSSFFTDYLHCLTSNQRIDGKKGDASLIVWEDENVLLFVPKAQISQWELNLLVRVDGELGPVGNVVEANSSVRASIDQAILLAQQVLERLGARMVTSIEYAKRLGENNGQHLLYSFLPKLPWAMGGFTEAQGRYVVGHYPEDFASACRMKLKETMK